MDKKLGRLELVVLHVSPRQIADGGIGLPRPRIYIHAQASLKVPRSGSPLHRIILECDHAVDAMAYCKVIVKRSEFCHAGAVGRLTVAAIEVHQLRLVLLYRSEEHTSEL